MALYNRLCRSLDSTGTALGRQQVAKGGRGHRDHIDFTVEQAR